MDVFGSAQTADLHHGPLSARKLRLEISMYIGGGILGTILVIALIIFLMRRA
jgi:hypothetical protein